MSTLASGALPVDPARGGGEHQQLYHTPDGNGRASAPEGVDVAAGSAGSTLLAKSDAKLKKSNWLEEAMDTVVKAFQGDKDPTRMVVTEFPRKDPRLAGSARRPLCLTTSPPRISLLCVSHFPRTPPRMPLRLLPRARARPSSLDVRSTPLHEPSARPASRPTPTLSSNPSTAALD
ncbi:hypothetical protein AB1Y20_001011 [Prymnesium parvum]|uniref:Uncharacterized protein n=1 Tax=Prymnesium parvum TaxID=97485 RepID=A0AB34K8B4_PRYPA